MGPADDTISPYPDDSVMPDQVVEDAVDDEEAVPVSLAGWVLDLLRLAAIAYLSTCVMLTGVTLLPQLGGWDSAVITTGSMEPTIHPGDVVVYDHPDPASLKVGHVILFTDPAHPSRQLTHRIVRIRPDGKIVTKGDANRSADLAPVPMKNVHGRGRLVAPFVGRLALLNTPNARGAHLWLASIFLAVGTLWISSMVNRRRPDDLTGGADPTHADNDDDDDVDTGVPAKDFAAAEPGR